MEAAARDHGRLSAMDASYAYLRQFTPQVLAAVDFTGGPGTAELMAAVEILKKLNATGGRKVPADAPDSFVPARYADYLEKARKVRRRHRLPALLGAVRAAGAAGRAAHRVMCTCRGRAATPTRRRTCTPRRSGRPGRPSTASWSARPPTPPTRWRGQGRAARRAGQLEKTLAGALRRGTVRLDGGDIGDPELTAEDVPAEARELKDELTGMLPFAPIASLLIELDKRTGFLDCFTHAGRPQAGPQRRAQAQHPGGADRAWPPTWAWPGWPMPAASPTTCWPGPRVVRAGGDAAGGQHRIVNHHHSLELARVFGGGTMSSSDGQRFPVRGKSLTGREMVIHGGQVLSTYTHVSDQHSTFGTKVIVPTAREAHYVLDEFLGNATDLPVSEHATDTHGVTLINFGLFDLVGKALSPRIRDLSRITLVRDDTPAEIAKLLPARRAAAVRPVEQGPGRRLLARTAADGRVAEVRAGTASLIVGKWSAASRQNTMAAALKEWGMLRRTIHTAKYLSDPAYRRKIARQLNKGESLHALRRDLHYAQQGTITQAAPGRADRAGLVPDRVDQRGGHLDDRVLPAGRQAAAGRGPRSARRDAGPHLPGHSENINFFGVINVDIEAELAKLSAGWRPLRPAQLRELGAVTGTLVNGLGRIRGAGHPDDGAQGDRLDGAGAGETFRGTGRSAAGGRWPGSTRSWCPAQRP